MHLLNDGLTQLGLTPSQQQIEQLEGYLALLQQWNKAYNLTAIRKPEQMITHHLLDSAAIIPHLQGPEILDVGSGAGLPGIPIAILKPELLVTCLECNTKRVCFLKQINTELKLDNLAIAHTRVEDFHPDGGFNTITSRAFTQLDRFVDLTKTLLAPEGIWLAMKGKLLEEELSVIQQPLETISLTVPGIEAERHLIKIKGDRPS